ncbi:MAG: trypsin-like peptidase domain-containing protein, partial [Candidatus Magasanikbacteria bacterium]|nr:trypsin-like peptidase domain-containing protein [Candidatus Magasanikbacteria bacterium]
IIVTKDVPLLGDVFIDLNLPLELKSPDIKIDENTNRQQVGGGSGFIVRSNGLIITNKHVVSDSDSYLTVVLNDGKRYPAIVLAKDQFSDIALIKIEAKNLPVISLGNSDKLEIGQTVVAIGNALGQYQNSVTSGIISGVKRRVVADGLGISEVIEAAIQTDAAINPGNSGGPLLNLQGQAVGINTAVNLGSQSVGFALPINSAKVIVESVEKYGHIVRPWLGVRYILINKAMAEESKLALDYGALVIKGIKTGEVAVVPGSPADQVGIVENDVILELNGQKVTEENGLGILVNKYKVGQEVNLKVWHKGETKIVKVKLEEAISN